MGHADRCTFNDVYLGEYNTGFMRVTSDTVGCRVTTTTPGITRANISGNAAGRCSLYGGDGPDISELTAITIPKISVGGVQQTASTASATPVALFTATTGAYRVYAWITGVGSLYTATADVIFDGTNAVIVDVGSDNGANMAFSISGASVQATQTSGNPQVIQYTYIKIA